MKNTIIALATTTIAIGSVSAQQTHQTVSNITASSITFTDGTTGSLSNGFISAFNPATALTNTDYTDVYGPSASIYDIAPGPNGITTITFSQALAAGTLFAVYDLDRGETLTLTGSTPFGAPIAQFEALASANFNPASNGAFNNTFDIPSQTLIGPGDSLNAAFNATLFDVAGFTSITLNNPTSEQFAQFGFLEQLPTVAVPEPSSSLLLGLGALGFFSRRKR